MFFERMIILLFKVFSYSAYRRKYKLPEDFRFNGYFIRISGGGKLICGKRCYVSYFSYLNIASGTRLILGDGVSIGHNVKIYTSTFDAAALIEKGERIVDGGDVVIGSNVLIGANVFVCPGITIGDNVVVGANSVVTKNLLSGCVYGGVPARVIRQVGARTDMSDARNE